MIEYEAVAVAKAACDEGIARHPITDWDGYRRSLRKRIGQVLGNLTLHGGPAGPPSFLSIAALPIMRSA